MKLNRNPLDSFHRGKEVKRDGLLILCFALTLFFRPLALLITRNQLG